MVIHKPTYEKTVEKRWDFLGKISNLFRGPKGLKKDDQ